ncbi:RidA family protein [Oligoflexus tunisiensis]|uniref:RidA family protein n=1 Tax=Oligoflexus tunisiensis TaxID=708132 RepID=UPI000A84E60E|nr:RidA family protein [Oligoflexus tunisiensis]
MTLKTVETKSAPAAIGPYSQAVIHGGLVYCSGQIPINPSTGELIEGSIEEQTHQVMLNLKAVLEAAGSGWSGVIRTTIYLQNLENFAKVNEVYASYLSKPYPARATVQVAKLPRGVGVEIDAIACQI